MGVEKKLSGRCGTRTRNVEWDAAKENNVYYLPGRPLRPRHQAAEKMLVET